MCLSEPTWGALRYCWHAFYYFTSRPTWQLKLRLSRKQFPLPNVSWNSQITSPAHIINHPCYLSGLWGLPMRGTICWRSVGITLLPSPRVCHRIPGCVNGAPPWRKTWCNGSTDFSWHGVPSQEYSGTKLSQYQKLLGYFWFGFFTWTMFVAMVSMVFSLGWHWLLCWTWSPMPALWCAA